MRKRDSYKTMSLEGLELEYSHVPPPAVWSPVGRKWERYKLKETETEKTKTTYYLHVSYNMGPQGNWIEEHRHKHYRRQTKYLAINGPLERTYILRDTPGYKLFYTQYGTGDSNLPRKVMIDVDSLARKLGLLW
jgi:hypothetical protein